LLHPFAQASLIFPYGLPCALYHFCLTILIPMSFVFLATRLLHFFFLYTFYHKKADIFKGDKAVQQMKIFKTLTSGVFYGVTITAVVLFGVLTTVIVSAATGINIYKSPAGCNAIPAVTYTLISGSAVLAAACIVLFFLTFKIPGMCSTIFF
jgi:sterol desaturase/sphingolipid hydroxylase (fatty acid hydroxylase superfamily)